MLDEELMKIARTREIMDPKVLTEELAAVFPGHNIRAALERLAMTRQLERMAYGKFRVPHE